MQKITAFAYSQTTNRVLYLVHLYPPPPSPPITELKTEFHVGPAHATDMRSANDIIRSS